ncbi:MAG: ParB-like nuclease domain-containing protein [Clostridiales bacterium]|nr:ParB-like nuclease domain-containing protein [Clostridiales bacterium]
MEDYMNYTVKEAIRYSSENNIETWVHAFLSSVGNNLDFSKGLKLQHRYWLGPIKLELNKFSRCCGPEIGLNFYEPEEHFERRVNQMINSIKAGWEMPPLIVKYEAGVYELNDGNHRYEALKRCGIKSYWIILWDSVDKIKDYNCK